MSESNEPAQVTFIAFIYSLARNALVHLGELQDPVTNEKRPPDLDASGQLIEIIGMLEEKTRGNLTAEERQFIDEALFDLRMRHVKARQARSPIIQP